MINRFGQDEINSVILSIKNSSLLSGYTNKFLGGETLQKFEKEFARFHNCKYGVSVNSGTSALFVAQLAAGIKNNTKEIIDFLDSEIVEPDLDCLKIACGKCNSKVFYKILNTQFL